MGLYEQFPYANFHELNLQWLLQKLKDLETRVTAMENIDVRQLIVNELNVMIEDGTFENLFSNLLESLRQAIAELESLVESNSDDIASLNASQLVQDGLISTLRTDMSHVLEDIESLRAAIQILDPTGEIGDIADTIAAMQVTINGIVTDITTIENTLANHETRISALENGENVPFELIYESKDCTNLITFYDFIEHIHLNDGIVKIGNFYNTEYADPETLENVSATCVCADRNTIIVRNTKHYKFGMPNPNNSGYGGSTIKVYADLLVQAICATINWSLTPQSVAIAYHNWLQIGDEQPVVLAPYYIVEQHYGLLLSSCAVFGYPAFGALENNGFNQQLAIFKYENVVDNTLLSDVVMSADKAISDNTFTAFGLPSNCRIKTLRSVPHFITERNTYNVEYPVIFAFKV